MKISCCWMYALEAYGYPPNLADTYKALKRIVDAGFNYIEFEAFGLRDACNIEDLVNEKKELKKFIDDLNMTIVNFPIMLPGMTSLDAGRRDKSFDLFDKALEVGVHLGAEMVSICSFNPSLRFIGEAPYEQTVTYDADFRVQVDSEFNWQKQWEVIVNTFSICNEKLKKAGIKLMIEPRVGEMVSNTDAVLRLLDAVNDDNFGVIFEIAHLHAQKEILPLSVEKLGSRIFYLHAADNDGRDNAHNRLGDGTVDWEAIMLALKKHDFQGYAGVDIRPTSPETMDSEYVEARQFLERIATKVGL